MYTTKPTILTQQKGVEMLDWKPDRTKVKSLHLQIKDYIKDLIRCGRLQVGDKLPAQTQMSKSFEVNRSTIVLALDELKADGLIDGKTKGGTRVIGNTWSLFLDKPQINWQAYSESGSYQSSIDVAKIIFENEYSENFIRLGAGELSEHIISPDMVQELTQTMASKITRLGYCHPQGFYDLRMEIIKYYKRFNITIAPREILIVNGISQAYHLLALGMLNKGDTALIEKQSYIGSLKTLQSTGIKVYGVQMDDLGIMPSKLRRAKQKTGASILFTNPFFQNPTGTLMSPMRASKLIEACVEEQLPVVEDDTYRELYFGDECPKPLLCYDETRICMLLGSLSKTMFPGLRLGWIVANASIIDRLVDIKAQTDISSSIYDQTAALELFKTGLIDKYLNIVRTRLNKNCDYTVELLDKYFKDIATWKTPKGGYYIWLKITKNISLKKVFMECYKRKVLIAPGFLYHHASTREIRLSYAYPNKEELKKGLIILSEVINEIKE